MFQKIKLKEVGKIISGGTPSTKKQEYFINGNIPWITPSDMSCAKSRWIEKGERMITEMGLKKSSARLIPENSILLTSRAPIGYLGISKNSLTTNQGFKNIVVKNDYDFLYIYYQIKNNIERIKQNGSGSTFKEISGSVLSQFEIFVHKNKYEQKKISKTLNLIDSKIELNKQINDNLVSYCPL